MSDETRSDLPGIGNPAKRALEAAGITQLEQLCHVTEHYVANLHGVGPKAIRILREALHTKGWSFAAPDSA